MARAKTRTWLSLDEWAAIVGIDPLHFNQLKSTDLQPTVECGHVWLQESWQNAHRLGREDVAIAISKAEQSIANMVGYSLVPDWEIDERARTERFYRKELFDTSGRGVRGQLKSVFLEKGHFISGGQQVKTGIETATVVRSDEDGDGYDETVTVTVGTSVTDPGEIRVYYPGESAADEWEIRPIEVSISALVATITFKSWQIVAPDDQLAIDADAIEADTAGNYLSTVDVYRVYNDPQQQVQFLWESDPLLGFCACNSSTCNTCQHATQFGCLRSRNPRTGNVAYAPATWDSGDFAFDPAEYAVGRQPDQLRLWYYAGWQNKRLTRSLAEMDDFWKRAVTFYAASLLDRPSCGCSNVQKFIEDWRVDRAEARKGAAFAVSAYQLDNQLGTTNGALYALRCVDMPNRKIGQ